MLSFGTLGVYRDSAAGSGYAVGMLLMVIFAWLGGSVAGTSILGGVDAAGIAIVQNGLGGKQWHHGSVFGWGLVEDPYSKTGAAAALKLRVSKQRVVDDNGAGKIFSCDGSGQDVFVRLPLKLSKQVQFVFQVYGSNLSFMHTAVGHMALHDGAFKGQVQDGTSLPRALQAFSVAFLAAVRSFFGLSKAGGAAECDVSGTAALLKLGFWTSGAMLQMVMVSVKALSCGAESGMRTLMEFDIKHFWLYTFLPEWPAFSSIKGLLQKWSATVLAEGMMLHALLLVIWWLQNYFRVAKLRRKSRWLHRFAWTVSPDGWHSEWRADLRLSPGASLCAQTSRRWRRSIPWGRIFAFRSG